MNNYVSENVIKIWGDFLEKSMGYSTGNFQKLADFLKSSQLENLSSESAQNFYTT